MITSLDGIKHVSFDFWNTLAIPNKEYAALRTELLATAFKVPVEEAKRVYTSTKKFMDTAAELSGFALCRDDVLRMLNAQMPKGNRLEEDELLEVGHLMDQLFIQNLPEVPQLVVDMVEELVFQGITASILSNTNFIKGELLLEHVIEPKFGTNMLFSNFSDEWLCAKPDADFYNSMVRAAVNVREMTGRGVITRANILHFGDNEITDGVGAVNAGIHHIIIQDPNELGAKLKELLQ